jgi:hypothetical protein
MTNNKQSMKLYTEEEIRKFFTEKYDEGLSIDELIEILTPIEQSKYVEKVRMESTWIAALDFGIEKMKGLNTLESKDAFEKFYKTTYGGNK